MPAHRTRGVALLVVLALALVGCSSGSGGGTTAPAGPRPSAIASSAAPAADTPDGLRAYYRQRLNWQPCRTKLRCARLRVPLDYADPGGRSIEIALLKVPAREPRRRLGSLVVDPGGPGASGVDYAANAGTVFGRVLRAYYDIVGFDPRGVGRSAPVVCEPDRQLNRLLTSDPDPATAAEVRYSDGLLRQFGRGCLRRSGGIARHMSTREVARDLDIARAVVGDRKLSYFGASYGTAIGATYADLFPTRVGRMVLDGALDPRLSTLRLNLGQARGFEGALRAYLRDCIARGGCFLGSTVDRGARRIKAFLDRVEATPLPAGPGRRLTVGNAGYGVTYPLYDRAGWPVLSTALQRAFAGDGSVLMSLADAYLSRNPDGTFQDNSFQAFYAVSCADRDDAVPSSRLQRYRTLFDRASPTFGRAFLYSVAACQDWPVHTGRGARTVRATGAAPILVVGTTRDPATPYAWARSLARQLDNAVLLTRVGDGHTGYRRGSDCTDRTVEAYLVSGAVPRRDVRCS